MKKRIAASPGQCLLPRFARILKLGTSGSNWRPRTVTGFSLNQTHRSILTLSD